MQDLAHGCVELHVDVYAHIYIYSYASLYTFGTYAGTYVPIFCMYTHINIL